MGNAMLVVGAVLFSSSPLLFSSPLLPLLSSPSLLPLLSSHPAAFTPSLLQSEDGDGGRERRSELVLCPWRARACKIGVSLAWGMDGWMGDLIILGDIVLGGEGMTDDSRRGKTIFLHCTLICTGSGHRQADLLSSDHPRDPLLQEILPWGSLPVLSIFFSHRVCVWRRGIYSYSRIPPCHVLCRWSINSGHLPERVWWSALGAPC